MRFRFYILFVILLTHTLYAGIFDSKILCQFEQAYVTTNGNTLHVETGQVSRDWEWTGNGLVTTSFKNMITGTEWIKDSPDYNCDWNFPGLIDNHTTAELDNICAEPVRFDPYTSDHIKVVLEIKYPAPNLQLKYEISVYPNSPGIRTQIFVKRLSDYTPPESNESNNARVEYLPVKTNDVNRRVIGYYNETQRRNKRETEILREELIESSLQDTEKYDWASLIWLENGVEGVGIVKESHKCVNQQGLNTGYFTVGHAGLVSTGLSLTEKDILFERYRPAWASWSIAYQNGDTGRELALKTFDRDRYPIDPVRDIYILANTWGSSDNKQSAQSRASEENVIKEIKSQADLGIDVQQVDDGWQGSDYDSWKPVEERYPNGWGKIRQTARENNVILGLWAAGERISLEDLKFNFDQGGFNYYKLDFINLKNYDEMEELITKVHQFTEYTHHLVRVNWDVTENPPRMGYYFGREYGNIYLENRKPVKPDHVVYVPYLVLRDAWQLAKYVNLNKFQISVQNIDRVNPDLSDANKHNHLYCVAITLMGSPIFFQETQFYDEQDRKEIRPLLALYKKHRNEMYKGYVYPIGEKPDNASWTGFQNHNQTTQSGYITLFREIENQESSKTIQLHYLAGQTIELTDLINETTRTVKVDDMGNVEFEITQNPDFRFFKYIVL